MWFFSKLDYFHFLRPLKILFLKIREMVLCIIYMVLTISLFQISVYIIHWLHISVSTQLIRKCFWKIHSFSPYHLPKDRINFYIEQRNDFCCFTCPWVMTVFTGSWHKHIRFLHSRCWMLHMLGLKWFLS